MSKRPEPPEPEAYARLFEGNADGVRILDYLIQRFHEQGIFVPDDKGGERETCRRIGRREPIDYIVSKINQAHVGHEDNHEHEPG